MSFGITSTVLASAVANAGTFTVAYPSGTAQAFFTNGLAGASHVLVVNNNEVYTSGFSLSFGASEITVTNSSLGTLAAGSIVVLQVDRQGPADFTLTNRWDNDIVYLAFPITLASLSNAADCVNAFVPGIRATIEHAQFQPIVTGTGSGADITLQPRIGSTNVTGGAVNVVVAAAAANAACIQGTTITAANSLSVNSTLSVRATVGTAFTAGSGVLSLRLRRSLNAG